MVLDSRFLTVNMTTLPRECRQFKNIGLQASVSVIPAKAGTQNPVAGKYGIAANGLWIPAKAGTQNPVAGKYGITANGLWIPAFAGMTVNMTTLPSERIFSPY